MSCCSQLKEFIKVLCFARNRKRSLRIHNDNSWFGLQTSFSYFPWNHGEIIYLVKIKSCNCESYQKAKMGVAKFLTKVKGVARKKWDHAHVGTHSNFCLDPPLILIA